MNRRSFIKQLGLTAAGVAIAPAAIAKALATEATPQATFEQFFAGEIDVLQYQGWTIEFVQEQSYFGTRIEYGIKANKPRRSQVRKAVIRGRTDRAAKENELFARRLLIQWFTQELERLELEAKAHYYEIDMPYEELQHSRYGKGYE